MAAYLEEHILDKSSRRWYGARWQSGLGSICIGYNTYTSNSQERMWRTLKGSLPKDGRHLDLGDLVQNTAQLLLTWTRTGQFASVFFRLETPLPVHLSNKGKQIMSEPDVDPCGVQHRRLSAAQMREWLEEHGAEHTYLKEVLDGARVLIDGRTKAVAEVYVLPKYQMKLALEKPEELQSRLDLFMSCLHEDPELMMRQSLGNVHMWSFKRHKSLFYRYVLVCCLADGQILDEHPHFTHDTASEHAAFVKSLVSDFNLNPIAHGPKAHKRGRAKKNKQSAGFREKVRTPSPEVRALS